MKCGLWILLFLTCLSSRAELPYHLPAQATYTASEKDIARARSDLSRNLTTDTVKLAELFHFPLMCGPGLWDLLKTSPHFSKPPLAKSSAKIPITNGKFQEFPVALLQNRDEVDSFLQGPLRPSSLPGSFNLSRTNPGRIHEILGGDSL